MRDAKPSSAYPPQPPLPAWITPDLVRLTMKTWQPFYSQPLTEEDAVEMLTNAGRLLRSLTRKT